MSLFANPAARSSGASLSTADGRSLALVGARLRGEARGGIARLVLEQRFANPFEETLDVTYRMPLPADGAVSAYAFEIGNRVVEGRVDKKAAARETFERALLEGRTAALLEQNTNDIFTQQIGNLPSKEELVARITVDVRLAWLPEGEWELRFPTVIGPRYIGANDTEADARATHVSVDPAGIPPGIQIAIKIGDTIVSGRTASSPSHTLLHRGDGSLELKDAAALDRDIVVRWPVATAKPGLSLDVARRDQGDAFALLTIVPPARAAKAAAVPRDLIVLLDTSGSMSGGPLDKAKIAVSMLVEALGEQDRLELIEFSNSPRRYKKEPVVATEKEKAAAVRWIQSRTADGGTEMASAVYEALKALRPNAQRQVVLVTDGYIGGEAQIVKLLHENLPKSCRMHVLGVGSAVNRSLATALARAGRGAEVLVGLDEDAERAIKRMVDRTKSPILTNVTILGSGLVRHAPEHVPDVYEGSPIVAGLEVNPEGGEIVVRGELANREPWEQRVRVPAKKRGDGNAAIAALFAREHVADLETRWTIGDTHVIDREIEAVGLELQIATRLTSWVAVDMVRRVDKKGPSRHQNVPQNLPYGTKAESFGLRGGVAATLEEEDAEALEQSVSQRQTMISRVDLARDDYCEEAPSEILGEMDDFAREEATGKVAVADQAAAPRKEAEAMMAVPAPAHRVQSMQKVPRASADEPAPPSGSPPPAPGRPPVLRGAVAPPPARPKPSIVLETPVPGSLVPEPEAKEPVKPGLTIAGPKTTRATTSAGGTFAQSEAPGLIAPAQMQQMRPKRRFTLWLAIVIAMIVLALLAYWLVL